MQTIATFATLMLLMLSSLYIADRTFCLIKCFIKGERFNQMRHERLLSFLSIAYLITYLIVLL